MIKGVMEDLGIIGAAVAALIASGFLLHIGWALAERLTG